MNLNTDHPKRRIQTLRSALTFFEQAEAASIDQEVFRNAIVKGYELAQETSFQLLRKALRDYGYGAQKLVASGVLGNCSRHCPTSSIPGVVPLATLVHPCTADATPVKDLLRLSATHGLMTLEEVERWFACRDNRNNTAHDYGEGFAKETLNLIPRFITDVARLEAVLRERYSEALGDFG